jgi:hypothetical protein
VEENEKLRSDRKNRELKAFLEACWNFETENDFKQARQKREKMVKC